MIVSIPHFHQLQIFTRKKHEKAKNYKADILSEGFPKIDWDKLSSASAPPRRLNKGDICSAWWESTQHNKPWNLILFLQLYLYLYLLVFVFVSTCICICIYLYLYFYFYLYLYLYLLVFVYVMAIRVFLATSINKPLQHKNI